MERIYLLAMKIAGTEATFLSSIEPSVLAKPQIDFIESLYLIK